MSALTRFEPLDDLFVDPFRDAFRRFLRTTDWPAVAMRAPSEMKLDVSETDREYVVKAEIPGAKKEDVNVKIDGNTVSISAEVKDEHETKGNGERTLTRERYYGSMSRAFSLPHEINDKEAQAKFDNGVLSLTLPKRSEARGTTLAIK